MSILDHTPTLERVEAYLRRVGENMSIPPVVRIEDTVHCGAYQIAIEEREHTDGGQPYSETYVVVSRTITYQPPGEAPNADAYELAAVPNEYEAVKLVAIDLLTEQLPRWLFGGLAGQQDIADAIRTITHTLSNRRT